LLGLLTKQPPAWLLLLLLAAGALVCWLVLPDGVVCAAAGGATMLRVSCTTCHLSSRSADVVLVMEGLAFTCSKHAHIVQCVKTNEHSHGCPDGPCLCIKKNAASIIPAKTEWVVAAGLPCAAVKLTPTQPPFECRAV
jgi:hypothetical protein